MNTLLALCFELTVTSSTGIESQIVVNDLWDTSVLAATGGTKIETHDEFWVVDFGDGSEIIVDSPYRGGAL